MRMPPCTFGRYLTADDLSRISGMHETPGSSLTREHGSPNTASRHVIEYIFSLVIRTPREQWERVNGPLE